MFSALHWCLSLVRMTVVIYSGLALLGTGVCLACCSLLWKPLVNWGTFSPLAGPLLCSAVLHILPLGRASLPVVLALCLPRMWFIFALLNAFERSSVASSTRKGQCEAVVHMEKTFNRGVISSGDGSECCFLLGITLQMHRELRWVCVFVTEK